MVALMDSADERVALMAADKIYERAWGKPRDYDPATDDAAPLRHLLSQLPSVKLTPRELHTLEAFAEARLEAQQACEKGGDDKKRTG
jgi:hypothetical protein